MTILEKVRKTIAKYGMVKKGDRVLVGVSGGADSVALLHILNNLAGELGISLHIAHLDHMLRGQESYRDMLFVKKSARKLNIPVTVSRINIPQIVQKNGSSLEDTARYERYEFFLKTALKINANKIATAHTMDDQSETVMMRLLRGSGVAGLRGIPPARHTNNCLIIRPMIHIRRREIEDYLKENETSFRFDSSNLDVSILRNRLRLKLLPLIKKDYNPNIIEVLANIAENLNDTFEYMEEEAVKAYLKAMEKSNDGKVVISLNKLKMHPLAIQKEIVRMALRELKGDLNSITYSHWQDVDSLIKEKRTGASLDLPDGIRCVKEYDKLIFCKVREKERERVKGSSYAIQLPGVTDVPEMGIEIVTKILKGRRFLKTLKSNGKSEAIFDLDKLTLPLSIRHRIDGDRMAPLGMKGTKKLKDLFIDEKIPRDVRERMPVIITGSGAHEKIIWVPPLRMSDEVKVTEKTKRVLRISLLRQIVSRSMS